MRRIFLILCSIIIIASINVGCSQNTLQTSENHKENNDNIQNIEVAVGEPVIKDNVEVIVTKVEKLSKIEYEKLDLSAEADENHTFLGVQIKYKNVSNDDVSLLRITPYTDLISPNGNEIKKDAATIIYRMKLHTTCSNTDDLKPNQEVTDAFVFNVNKNDLNISGWKLRYSEDKNVIINLNITN